jgi:hypothetical protein
VQAICTSRSKTGVLDVGHGRLRICSGGWDRLGWQFGGAFSLPRAPCALPVADHTRVQGGRHAISPSEG